MPTVTVGYDGAYRVASHADGKSQTTAFAFDNVSNLSETTMPGHSASWPGKITFPLYDDDGNLKRRISSRNGQTDFTRASDDSRVTGISYTTNSLVDPTNDVTVQHDSFSRVTKKFSGTGTNAITLDYKYDDLGNYIETKTTYGNLPAQTITYTYNDDGSRKTMTTSVGTFYYHYDSVGNMISMDDPVSGQTVSWEYDDLNRLKKQTTPVTITNYTYNAIGQKKSVINTKSNTNLISKWINIAYDGMGNMVAANETFTHYSLYSGLRAYSYDLNGSNKKNQLLTWSGFGFNDGDAYDAAGNELPVATSQGWIYNERNQIGGSGSWNTWSDADGNYIYPHSRNYGGVYQFSAPRKYDAENRLTSMPASFTYPPSNYGLSDHGSMSFGYRPDNLRAWKDWLSKRRYFIYDGTNPLFEVDPVKGIIDVNVFGADGLVSRHFLEPGFATRTLFYLFDNEGNTSERVLDNGEVLSVRVNVGGWGTGRTIIKYDINTNLPSNPQLCPSRNWNSTMTLAQQYDIRQEFIYDPYDGYKAKYGYYSDYDYSPYFNTQLNRSDDWSRARQIYCVNRYYDPAMRRWLTRDPKGYSAGPNLYVYCNNNPIMNIDPDGLDIKVIDSTGKNAALKLQLEQALITLKRSATWRRIVEEFGPGKNPLDIIIDTEWDKSIDSETGYDKDITRGATGYRERGKGIILINPLVFERLQFYYKKPGEWGKTLPWRVLAHEIGHVHSNLPKFWWNSPASRRKEEQMVVDKYENEISKELGVKYIRGKYEQTRDINER